MGNKNIKLFIIVFVLTVLVGWSILSLYVIIRDKGRYDTLADVKLEIFEEVKQDVYNLATNDIVNTIRVQIENRGEIGIDIEATDTSPARRIILIEKVVSENLK